MKRKVSLLLLVVFISVLSLGLVGCEVSPTDAQRQQMVSKNLEKAQPTPTDIEYSLERYNLIRRAYWVNGQREKAINLPCPINKPLGYVVLMTESGAVVNKFIVDGKITSLNSYITPDSEEYADTYSLWLADVDGSYGQNDDGVFSFTPDGNYHEWNGLYYYTDVPVEVSNPIVTFKQVGGAK